VKLLREKTLDFEPEPSIIQNIIILVKERNESNIIRSKASINHLQPCCLFGLKAKSVPDRLFKDIAFLERRSMRSRELKKANPKPIEMKS